jgi:hypothetical protein
VIAMTDTHVWLEYPDNGNKAQFSIESAGVWQQRGWRPCDPPLEPDVLRDPPQPEPAAEQEPEPEPAPADAPVADEEPATEPTTTRRGRGASKES